MDSCKNINWSSNLVGIKFVQSNNFNKSLFILFSNTFNNKRSVPNNNITNIGSCDCHFGVWNENCFCEKSHGILWIVKIFLLNSWRIILELRDTLFPIQKQNSLSTVRSNFCWVIWIKLDPVLVLKFCSIFEL